MSIPEDLLYTKDHEWARVEGNIATLGITDHAQEQLGDVVYVELPDEEDDVTRGETFGSVESTKAVSDVYSPVTGKVIAANTDLPDNPELINNDPYGDGWMIKVELSDKSELSDMMKADSYAKFLEDEAE
jgi:glycine cleavage system H protein